MSEMSQVAAAIQKQVMRDFGPAWDIEATVGAFPSLEDVPTDYWKATVIADIGSSAYGFHRTETGQPYALIQWRDHWSISASHEILEMLADPGGDRLIAGQSPHPEQGRVQFLVEVCDPCADDAYHYTVNNVPVSCFYTKRYFDPVTAPGVQYSFTEDINEPRKVLPGGYLTWLEPETNTWWQQWHFDGANKFFVIDPDVAAYGSLRSAVDQIPPPAKARKAKPGRKTTQAIKAKRAQGVSAQAACAARFRAEIARWRKPL